MISTSRFLAFALVACFYASHCIVVVHGYQGRVEEQGRLHGWSMTESQVQEQYLSIFCRCCGATEGARNISLIDIPDCLMYEGESCKCPVREETGTSWWNLFGTNYQERWNDSCRTKIPERANITLVSSNLEEEQDPPIVVTRNGET